MNESALRKEKGKKKKTSLKHRQLGETPSNQVDLYWLNYFGFNQIRIFETTESSMHLLYTFQTLITHWSPNYIKIST